VNKIRAQVRTMSLLCLLLGPVLIVMSLMGFVAKVLMERAEEEGFLAEVPPGLLGMLDRAALDFAVESSWVSVPLGLVLLVCGALALRDPARGRVILIRAAWISAVAMIGLGAMWSLAVEHSQLGIGGHISGWLGHGLQAGLAIVTARWLGKDDVRAACETAA